MNARTLRALAFLLGLSTFSPLAADNPNIAHIPKAKDKKKRQKSQS